MVKYLFWGMVDTCEDVHIVSTFKKDVVKKTGTEQGLQTEAHHANNLWKRDQERVNSMYNTFNIDLY